MLLLFYYDYYYYKTENVSLIPDIPTDTVTVHLSDVIASVFNNQDFMQSPFPKITEQVLFIPHNLTHRHC